MAYPENIDKFNDKLNKLENNAYVIEEKVDLVNGAYENELEHDNISLTSLNVYTGEKLTGNKIETYTLATPSTAPWKKIIKIYSSVTPLYISYETTGDTVEADDINKVQDSIVNIENEVDKYKSSNDTRVTAVENNKAEKTYVDTEFNKRYLKTETYTKEETDQRIQLVVNAAPSALDTLKELADALNDDPNFAATITTELSKKVDKVDGKQLSTEDYSTVEKNKLAGIENNANNYIHPASHPATMILEDSTHRWTTDAEKSNWNDANNKKHTHGNLSLLETITQTLIGGWNSAYSHISDAVKHITKDERTLWNTVNDKANTNHNHDDRYYTESESDTKYATKDDLSKAGYGDMLKSVYDTNNDGIVNNASALEGHSASYFAKSTDIPTIPTSLPANGGTANKATITHRLYRHDPETEDAYFISPYWTGSVQGWRIGAYNTNLDEQQNIHTVSVNRSDYADSAGNSSKVGGFLASGTTNTSEKSNLIGMINEVFQSASSSLTQLNNDKNNLYSAIVGKGITPSSKSMSDLITSIGNIPTGKKYASGTVTCDSTLAVETVYDISRQYVDTMTFPHVTFDLTKISFTPTKIIIKDKNYALVLIDTTGGFPLNAYTTGIGTMSVYYNSTIQDGQCVILASSCAVFDTTNHTLRVPVPANMYNHTFNYELYE